MARDTIKELEDMVKLLKSELDRISEAGLAYGLVVSKDGDYLVAHVGGKVARIANNGKAKIGDSVWVHPGTMQIVDTAGRLNTGVPVTVSRVCDLGLEIHSERGPHFVFSTLKGLAKGDRVLVDESQSVAFALIEKAPKPAFAPSIGAVHWDEIGGQEEAKRLLREAVEYPRKHSELYKKFGKRPTKGILLKGPPGCGKTMLARAVATSIGADKGGFLAIKGPEVLDPYVGVTEQTIRAVFRQAEAYRKEHNREAVIFVDEAESLLCKRGTPNNFMGQTVVPTFLTEMDGLEESSAIVILATNREDALDPAIIRDGRIDHKVEVARPTQDEAAAIFDIYLRELPLAVDIGDICTDAAEILYSVHHKHLPHSGALIEGIVEKAKMFAIRRGVERKSKSEGITQDDVFSAIEQVRNQEAPPPKQKGAWN